MKLPNRNPDKESRNVAMQRRLTVVGGIRHREEAAESVSLRQLALPLVEPLKKALDDQQKAA